MPDYGSIISQSIKVTKKFKWLWVYGLVITAFAAGAGGGGGSNASSNIRNVPGTDTLPSLPDQLPENLPDDAANVLGGFTSSLADWFRSVPVSTWVMLALVVFIAIVFSWLVKMVLSSWAKGGLIYASQQALEGKETTLANTSPKGIANIKNLIILGLITLAISLAIFVGLPLIWILVYLLIEGISVLSSLWIVLGVVFGILLFILAIIIIAMVGVYAERLIVLKGYSPWQAWKSGLKLSKGAFLPTLIMGIINAASAMAVGCVTTILFVIIVGVPALISIIPSITKGQLPSIPLIVFTIIAFIIFGYISLLARAIVVVFKYSNWNQLFESVLSKTEAQNG